MSQQSQRNQSAAAAITARRAELSNIVAARHLKLRPDLIERYGPGCHAKCAADTDFNLRYLVAAMDGGSTGIFADYLIWLRSVLKSYGVHPDILPQSLVILATVLDEEEPQAGAVARAFVENGLDALRGEAEQPQSMLNEETAEGAMARQYVDLLLRGDRQLAFRLVTDAVEAGMPIRDVYLKVFQAAQREIGRLWQVNGASVAQEHFCTAATQLLMAQFYPRVFAEADGRRRNRTLVAACVGGDLHELGLRMVADFFEMDGWDTHYLGANTPVAEIAGTAERTGADLLALSATMPYHLDLVRETITAVRSDRDMGSVPIMVGGRPFLTTPGLHARLGADATAPDAAAAVAEGLRLVEGG